MSPLMSLSMQLSLTDEIESLPLANTPEVLGLHSNAEIGYYTQAAKDMWTHLIDLQPQTGMPFNCLQIKLLANAVKEIPNLHHFGTFDFGFSALMKRYC